MFAWNCVQGTRTPDHFIELVSLVLCVHIDYYAPLNALNLSSGQRGKLYVIWERHFHGLATQKHRSMLKCFFAILFLEFQDALSSPQHCNRRLPGLWCSWVQFSIPQRICMFFFLLFSRVVCSLIDSFHWNRSLDHNFAVVVVVIIYLWGALHLIHSVIDLNAA